MRAEDVKEVYGNWSAIEALVADGANRTALLRQLYAELQRRRAGFEGLASDVFRTMTGCPEDQKLTGHPLHNSFWGLIHSDGSLIKDGKVEIVGKRSGSAVYRVRAEAEVVPKKRPTASKVSRTEKPKTWRDERPLDDLSDAYQRRLQFHRDPGTRRAKRNLETRLGSSPPAGRPATLAEWVVESVRMLADAGIAEPSLDRIEHAARALGWDGNGKSLRSAAWNSKRDGQLRAAGHGHYSLPEAAGAGSLPHDSPASPRDLLRDRATADLPARKARSLREGSASSPAPETAVRETTEDALAECVNRLADVVEELKDAVVSLDRRR